MVMAEKVRQKYFFPSKLEESAAGKNGHLVPVYTYLISSLWVGMFTTRKAM